MKIRPNPNRIPMRIFITGLIFLMTSSVNFAFSSVSSDSIKTWNPVISLSGFADVFYGFDFGKPTTQARQPFLYNHNRHNQFNLNLGYLKLSARNQSYRANLAFHSGTYVVDNYASEPDLLKNVFEANAGISLSKRGNVWLDAGIFSSHIGFESAISIDNWTLTRSLLAENSPYYLSGAKLTFTPAKKWELALLVCNGWQRIQPVLGNSLLSFGSQLKWMAGKNATVNWSTFIGTNDPDSTRRMRFFNNFYGQFQLSERVGFLAGFDFGVQQVEKGSTSGHIWYSPVAIIRYTISDKWFAAARAEYFQDKNQVVISLPSGNKFQTSGFSINFDYFPQPLVALRMEGRLLASSEKIFFQKSTPNQTNLSFVASIAVRLE